MNFWQIFGIDQVTECYHGIYDPFPVKGWWSIFLINLYSPICAGKSLVILCLHKCIFDKYLVSTQPTECDHGIHDPFPVEGYWSIFLNLYSPICAEKSLVILCLHKCTFDKYLVIGIDLCHLHGGKIYSLWRIALVEFITLSHQRIRAVLALKVSTI